VNSYHKCIRRLCSLNSPISYYEVGQALVIKESLTLWTSNMSYVFPPTCLWRETLSWDPVEAGSLPESDRPDIGQCLSNIRQELSRSRVLKNHCYKQTYSRVNSAMSLTEVRQDDARAMKSIVGNLLRHDWSPKLIAEHLM